MSMSTEEYLVIVIGVDAISAVSVTIKGLSLLAMIIISISHWIKLIKQGKDNISELVGRTFNKIALCMIDISSIITLD